MSDPVLSIVIVNCNAGVELTACLASLRAFPPREGHEVLVVDNASDDGSMARVAERFPDVRWLASRENLGFAAANNRGVARSTGRFVLLLNPDARVEDGALDVMLRYLQAHPGIGVLAPRQQDARGWPHVVYAEDPTFGSEWRRRRQTLGLIRGDEAWVRRVDGRYAAPADVDWVTGSCLMMPRRAYTRIGGMDETYRLYFEDADLCRRVRRAGLRVVYHPGVTLFHQRDAAIARRRAAGTVAYRVSQLHYARCHRGSVAAAAVRLGCLLRAALLRLFHRGLTSAEAQWCRGQLARLAWLGAPSPDWWHSGSPAR